MRVLENMEKTTPLNQNQHNAKISAVYRPLPDNFDEKTLSSHPLIISSPFDQGVRLNSGRSGARYAPKALSTALGNFILHHPMEKIYTKVQSHPEDPLPKLSAFEKIVHWGGGHETIYFLLESLSSLLNPEENLWVINVDAHCDTRKDNPLLHSGNPFRKFDEYWKKPWHLVQLGIHPFSNHPQTLSPLEFGSMEIHPSFTFPDPKGPIHRLCPLDRLSSLPIQEKDWVVLSIDADVLSSSFMEGVSAVNPFGMTLEEVLSIVQWYCQVPISTPKVLGIYEMNPIYDNLSQKAARPLALLVYHYITTSICALR